MSTRPLWQMLLAGLVWLCTVRTPALAESNLKPSERVLRIAYGEDFKTLDPVLMIQEFNSEMIPLLFTPLLDTAKGTNIFPGAASDWSASPDWRVFTFHLRPEIRFSNGRQVTASDYAYTLERMANPKTGSMFLDYLKGIRGAADFKAGRTNRLAGVTVQGDDTLIIELDQCDVTFPYVMVLCAEPREQIEQPNSNFATRPVCSGPYQVAEWRRGDRLILVPNPCYGGKEPRHFDRVEILLGLDEATQMMMFERGELDVVRVPFSQLQRTRRERALAERTESSPLMSSTFLVINTEMPPLNDVRVRQAITQAIDRPRRMLVRTGWFALAAGIIPPSMPGYNPRLQGAPYDPTRARALLAEAKVKLPLRMELWYAVSSPFTGALAQGISADLNAIGIELELKGVTQAQLDEATSFHQRVPLSLNGWNVALPDPKDMLALQFDGRLIGEQSYINVAFYNNPEVNHLLDEAATTTDLPLRYARYQRIEKILVEEAPYVFLGHRQLFALRQPALKGPLLDPLAWFRFDRIWLAP